MHLKAKKRNKATRSTKIYLHPHHLNTTMHMDGLAVSTKYNPRCLDDECLLKGIERGLWDCGGGELPKYEVGRKHRTITIKIVCKVEELN